MAFKMKGSPMQRNFGIGSPAKKVTDPEKSEDKRKAEEIHTYSAAGSEKDVAEAREAAKERSQRVEDMSQEEWDEMKRKEAEAKKGSQEKVEKRKEESEARKAEIARRNAMSKKERRKEDRKNK